MTTTVSTTNESIPSTAILALAFASFSSAMSMRIADSMLVRLSSEFGLALSAVSLVITVFGVVYGSAQLMFGPLGDRYGKYHVVSLACMVCSFTALLCGLAPDFPMLVGARALAGATCAALIPLSMAWIGDVVSYEHRQTVLARFMIGHILGLSTGIMLGGVSADYLNWRFPFFLITLLFFVSGVYLIRMNKRLPVFAKQVRKDDGHPVARTFFEFTRVLELPWARHVLMTVMLEGALVYGALAFVPTHLHTTHGLSLAAAGSLVMLFGFGGFAFAIFAKSLVKRLGEVGLIRYGALLMVVSMLLISYTTLWWLAIPGSFVFGLGFYMMHNTLQINATQMAPERRGAAVAAFASCFFFGQAAGVAMTASLLTFVGTAHLIAVSSIGLLLIGIRFARLRALKAD
jgi:predicted MFS family arabinose efflux permease